MKKQRFTEEQIIAVPKEQAAGDDLLVAALVEKGLYAFDEEAGILKPIFTSGDRLRDVLPVGQDIYVITTNRSPRA